LLVVENEATLRLELAVHLGSTYDVAAVASADEALRLVAQGASFDVVLCELTMPEMNGVQLCQRLARMESKLTSRVVLMASRKVAPASVRHALEGLPNPCITWPFEIDALADLLERHRARAASVESKGSKRAPADHDGRRRDHLGVALAASLKSDANSSAALHDTRPKQP
jgi:CheY-like chemotaxis protein